MHFIVHNMPMIFRIKFFWYMLFDTSVKLFSSSSSISYFAFLELRCRTAEARDVSLPHSVTPALEFTQWASGGQSFRDLKLITTTI
jgi:hypothetical protein